MLIYTTKSGDVWDKIAFDTMGSSQYTPLLMQNNSKYIHISVFPRGIELHIPEIPSADTVTAAPWRRDTV